MNTELRPAKTKQEHIAILASDLKAWSHRIEQVSAQPDKAEDYTKLTFVRDLGSLKLKTHAAAHKMKGLKEASDHPWQTARENAEAVWDDFKTRVRNAIAKF